jgi:iron complex transport system substrate-binding protein
VVGVTRDSDYPPAAADKPKVGTFWQPSVEAVIATRPDLIVTLAFEQQKDLARRLGRMGYDCLVVDIESVGDLFRAIGSIGQAADAGAEARELNRRIHEDIRRMRTAIAGMRRVKVLWVVQREPLRVAGKDTFINEMIELAGGENAIGSTLHTYPPIGAEEIIATGPEVIIEPTMADETTDLRGQAVSYWRKFTNVPAVRDERTYIIDGDLVSRLGPRLPAGIEAIAKCLRPERPGE